MAAQRHKQGAKPDRIKWGLLFAAALAVAALAVLCYQCFYHPKVDVDAYPVRGIDVSRHNGSIHWPSVAQAGIDFAFIKATEGASYTDPMLRSNLDGARRAGIKVGCYHFFRKQSDGARQARHFLNAVRGQALDLPLVVDVEDSNNDNQVDDAVVARHLTDMVAALERSGHKVMIYTNGKGYRAYYKPLLDGRELWLCAFKEPASIRQRGHRIQQYCHWGTVEGIDGDVDLDVFVGSRDQWNHWLEQVKQ